jgi:hypothetical protein
MMEQVIPVTEQFNKVHCIRHPRANWYAALSNINDIQCEACLMGLEFANRRDVIEENYAQTSDTDQ